MPDNFDTFCNNDNASAPNVFALPCNFCAVTVCISHITFILQRCHGKDLHLHMSLTFI